MKKSSRSIAILVWLGLASCLPTGTVFGQPVRAPDYEIHEWGVFTVPRDGLWLQQEMASEWSSFPDFFNGIWPRKNLAYRGPVRKPVIYFHTDQFLAVDLQIQFADGRPLIWWPTAEFPNQGGLRIKPKDGVDPESVLMFSVQLNKELERQRTVPKDHWIRDLRKVKSASITANASYGKRGGFGYEQESFIYYDGLMKAPRPPVIKRNSDVILLETDSDHRWHDVFVIERTGDTVMVSEAPLKSIGTGKYASKIKLVKADKKRLAEFRGNMFKVLNEAGLRKDEVQSLIDVWQEGLFEQQGLTLFYRIDQKTYDAWLPLKASPKPKKIARVGLVVHHHLEPELEERIKQLVKQLGSKNFQQRDAADRALRSIGAPAFKLIQETMKSADIEVKMRCQKILRLKELDDKINELMKKFAAKKKSANEDPLR